MAVRLMGAQLLIIVVGSLTLALTAALVAPPLFRQHLARAGIAASPARQHAERAFESSFAISLTVAAAAALAAAVVVSWVLVRRLVRPIGQLADAADHVAAGRYDVDLPTVAFSNDLQRLTDAFAHMACRLADSDTARSRLLSDLSHELRTPLATLTAYVDGMQDGIVPVESGSFDTMRTQVGRLRRLTDDVRQAATAQLGELDLHLQQVDLAALAADVVAAARPRYALRDVALVLTGRPGPSTTTVHGDPGRLAQVLHNLLDNALRHTPRGGHVGLTVSTRAGRVRLDVADDGPGIPPAEIEAIFDRFHRADPARTGTDGAGSGLGLTIARAIAAAHGGTLTAANDPPGATFTLDLPAATVTPRSG